MKKYINRLLSIVIIISIGSCSKLDSGLVNPNSAKPEDANVDLYLNEVQLNFVSLYRGLSEVGEELTRMEYLASRTYRDAYSPEAEDGDWTTAYAGVLKNADAMIPIAEKTNRYIHIGIVKILKAYTLGSLVDYFGDVPYSEAVQGNANLSPKADAGAAVYTSVQALLDAAIVDLGKVTSSTTQPTNDLYYGGLTAVNEAARWKTLAKTLKLKFLMQTRLVDNTAQAKIDALITENNLIDTDAEAFTFKYSSKELNPNSRHNKYNTYYTSTGANDYIGNQFMYKVFVEKGLGVDPRWRFYFYRQISNVTAVPISTLGCLAGSAPTHYPSTVPYCYGDIRGFYGRDHGDDQGIPPDGQIRTLWGLYPAGGKFDNSEVVKADATQGARGQGISPIWMPAFTYFLRAEAALKLSSPGDPLALLIKGAETSINTVTSVFPASVGQTIPANRVVTPAQISNYTTIVTNNYNNAADVNAKLNVVMDEYYLALWGNGIESYNNYRRTGMPWNMQPNINPTPGEFMRSMYYPSVFVNRNQNAVQKTSVNVKVFWDNNPDNIFVR